VEVGELRVEAPVHRLPGDATTSHESSLFVEGRRQLIELNKP
jgi:hypothetical protein